MSDAVDLEFAQFLFGMFNQQPPTRTYPDLF